MIRIGYMSLFALILRNFASEIAKEVLTKEKLFALISTRLYIVIACLFFESLQGNVKCLLPNNFVKLIY